MINTPHLIAEGGYGCVFSGSIDYDIIKDIKITSEHSHFIYKLYKDVSERDIEWENAILINKIDKKQKYFIYPIHSGNIAFKDLNLSSSNTSKCTLINYKNRLIPIVTIPYFGNDIFHYIRHNNLNLKDYIKLILPILKAVKLLNSKGFIHQDLKYNNIMFHNNSSKIIDFGMMQKTNEVFNEELNDFLYSENWLNPPEYKIITNTNNILSAFFKSINRKLNVTDKNTIQELIIQNYYSYQQYEDLFNKYIKYIHQKPSLINKYASKVDIYQLGLTFIYLLQFINIDSDAIKLHSIFKNMIHPDPRKRLAIQTAYNKLLSLI
jgi:serine/threonine protein kinase